MKFSDLDLHPHLQAVLNKINFTDCTPIQEQAVPPILKGRDVAGLAQTGTGKTAAFLLPLIQRVLYGLENDPRGFADWKKRQFILILVPTRELAEQVFKNAQQLTEGSPLSAVSIYGGTSYDTQKQALARGVELIIATPGRLIDLFKEHLVDLRQVRAVVFDEADRMFDMGFKDDMKFILKRLPRERQFLVFSATMNFDVLNVAYEFGADPVEVNISKDQPKAENVRDELFHVGQTEKAAYLLSIIKKNNPNQVIVFSNFKHNVERIAVFLNRNNFSAVGISSLLTQAQRTRVMAQFKAVNDRNILIATDLAARGLDILGVDMVINFDLPDDPENYVHRIGRTGRAGQTGLAFSLVSDRDVDALARIETYLGHKIETGWLESHELIAGFQPFPTEHELGRPKKSSRPAQRPQQKDFRRRPPPPRRDPRHNNEPPASSSHRDRQTGRHQAPHPPRPRISSPRPTTRPHAPHRAPRTSRPQSAPSRPPPPPSLGKKVSTFLKRLFGNK